MPENPYPQQPPTPQGIPPAPGTDISPQPSAPSPAPLPPAPPAPSPQAYSALQPMAQPVPQPPSTTPQSPMSGSMMPPMPPAPAAPAMPQAVVTSPTVMQGSSGRRKMPVIALVGIAVVVVLAASGAFAYRAYASRITLSDVKAAQHAADTMLGDIDGASNAAALLNVDSEPADINKDASTLSAKLTDAQKQYTLLKNSKIQHNQSVHNAFEAFGAKWPTFSSYMQGSVSDVKTLMPTLTGYEDKYQTLADNTPVTVAQFDTYLTKLKDATDSTSQKLASVHMATPEDKQMLTATQTFLHSASRDIALAKTDLDSGKDRFVIEGDLFKVEDAQNTFDTAESTYESNVSNHIDKLDPSASFIKFQNALDKLQSQLSK